VLESRACVGTAVAEVAGRRRVRRAGGVAKRREAACAVSAGRQSVRAGVWWTARAGANGARVKAAE
jgi:hypothetical protein